MASTGNKIGEGDGRARALKDALIRPDEYASRVLRKLGIPGHRYFDGMSRNAGEGSHNFVIYDDTAVTILEKQQKAQMVREAEASASEILRLMPRLRAELDRLDLKRVKLYFDPLEPDWQGMFQVTGDGDFEVIIGAALDPMKTLHHEVIHIMRQMNLFTPDEWRTLELAAGRGWMERHDIEARYPNLTREEQLEEAIAEEFSWALEKMRPPKGSILVHAFNKIHRLLKAIRNVFQGAGFNTPEDIFGRILSGEISKRQAWNTGYYARMGYNLQAAPRLAAWSRQVFALFRNERLPEMMDLGSVPLVLRRLGAISDRLVMPTGKAKTVTKTHRDLTPNSWLRLPDLIRDPEMIIDQADGSRAADILVVTSERSDDGNHVVVAVNRSGVDAENQPATVVVTLYPKQRLEETLAKAEREGKFLYLKARREGDGYKHIGANSRSASPVGDTISRLRATDGILAYDDAFQGTSCVEAASRPSRRRASPDAAGPGASQHGHGWPALHPRSAGVGRTDPRGRAHVATCAQRCGGGL